VRKRLRPARESKTASHTAIHLAQARPTCGGSFGSRMCLHRRFRGRGRRDRGRGRGGGIRTAAAKTPKWALARTAGRALRAAVGRARNCTCGVREINRIAQREGGWEEKASGGWAPGRRSAARFVASMPFGIARSTREARAETPRRVAPDAPDRRVGARASPERRPVAIRIERNPARSRREMRRGRSAPGTAARARARSAPWGPCKPWRRRRCS
jgi:hypothetical protein